MAAFTIADMMVALLRRIHSRVNIVSVFKC